MKTRKVKIKYINTVDVPSGWSDEQLVDFVRKQLRGVHFWDSNEQCVWISSQVQIQKPSEKITFERDSVGFAKE